MPAASPFWGRRTDREGYARKHTQCLLAGIDRSDLELMDPEERAEVLEDAGLDPDDFDL
ncbi:MAG: hypothetical protein K5696_06410 [Lachnospiraceae bacterium]|nr:hypothetical protein [Lachnospiraceae bacterium]